MKNIYKLDNIDCANCALKIEESLNQLNGVESSSLNFMTLKLYVSFNEEVVSDSEIEKNIHKSLNGVRIISKNNLPFEDDYEVEKGYKRILFRGRK